MIQLPTLFLILLKQIASKDAREAPPAAPIDDPARVARIQNIAHNSAHICAHLAFDAANRNNDRQISSWVRAREAQMQQEKEVREQEVAENWKTLQGQLCTTNIGKNSKRTAATSSYKC